MQSKAFKSQMQQYLHIDQRPYASKNKSNKIRIIISNLEGKSTIHTVNPNISGIELFNLAGIGRLQYKSFRLTVGTTEI